MTTLEHNFYFVHHRFLDLKQYCNKQNNDCIKNEQVIALLEDITNAVGAMCVCYANFPDDLAEFLDVVSNPLINLEDFHKEMVEPMRACAFESDEGAFEVMAEAMWFLRRLYNKDRSLIQKYFDEIVTEKNIDLVELEEFFQKVIRQHVTAIAQEIRDVIAIAED